MVVHHHRNHQLKKEETEEEVEESKPLIIDLGNASYKKTRPNLICLLFIFALISFSLVFAPRLYAAVSFYSFGTEDFNVVGSFAGKELNPPPCSSIDAGKICCDRTGYRSDICFMKGDIRTRSTNSSIFLYRKSNTTFEEEEEETEIEKIKPYTRKWETSIMNTIDELQLIVKRLKTKDKEPQNPCQIQHSVPALFFSTGGYTGNVYHEFNDGIIPLYISSKHFNKQVVFVILEYHQWWITKYGDILSHLSDYPPIDFNTDPTTHCFSEAIVGLRIHDELTIDSSQMPKNHSILDFRHLLDEAYEPRIRSLIQEEEAIIGNTTFCNVETAEPIEENVNSSNPTASTATVASVPTCRKSSPSVNKQPKLVIIARNGSREITNQGEVVKLAESIGFQVEVLQPTPMMELAKIYRALNSCDVMVGVHGAAMTHFLFMRPGSVFMQIVPLGTDWAAETYYGEPAMKLGLNYISYNILDRESSLYEEYDKKDEVLRDPKSVNKKGWQMTKRVYLDGQNVKLDIGRFGKRLLRAYRYSMFDLNSSFRRRWKQQS
ncbi:xylan glycosyltransferase MUCI21-like isoform X2 [Tasmannia lanceolata]|uniref:xylan glycosyltransferase MUCI21-like isoform X2 n=1 Tax=Tasmannia lanceolata TaxID=3420 RepID=UPI0040645544